MKIARMALATAALVLASPTMAARCIDETAVAGRADAETSPAPELDPRTQLAGLVRDALERSQALGAAQLLAEAALDDVEEVRAGKAGLTGGLGGIGAGARAATVPPEQCRTPHHGKLSVGPCISVPLA